jgi:hypothetical protein
MSFEVSWFKLVSGVTNSILLSSVLHGLLEVSSSSTSLRFILMNVEEVLDVAGTY